MLKDLVIQNRSYRGYDESRRLTKEELLEFVNLTRYTASSVNLQPLKYYIAYEKDQVDKIQAMTKWAAGLPQMQLPHPGMRPTGFIIICQDTSISPSPTAFLPDVGIAAQTILLAATEKGLGGCMIGNFKPQEVKEQLHLAESITPRLIVAIGKPAETVRLAPVGADGKTSYYRDENDVHYVPKRGLEDILL